MKTIYFAFILLLGTLSVYAGDQTRTLASVKHALRVEHARELMGKSYKRSIVSRFEKRRDMAGDILSVIQKRLPKKHKSKASEVAKTIIEEANKKSLDPYFVMAVIAGESSFNPDALGPVGEIGLMQIRKSTGKWMAGLTGMKWRGEATLKNPVLNIKLGVAYLSWLREKFEGHGQLYLAAYNMGPRNVKEAVSKKIYPKDYPIHVMKRYIAFYKEIGRRNGTL